MKRFHVAASILCLSAMCLMGCGEEEKEGKLNITTPRGEATITMERDAKQSDERPAPAHA